MLALTTPKKYISYRFLYLFGIGLILLGFAFDSPERIFTGMIEILHSPSNLLTDYFALAGVGATFFNSGLITLISIFMVQRMNLSINGAICAGIMTVAGFSFFGKDLFNSIPIMAGCLLYAKYTRVPPRSVVLAMLFGTSLAPVVSFIAFGMDLPLALGVPLGSLVGIMVGFIIPPTSTLFLSFHQGFNLYNFGFTAGIIAMALVGVLRMFGIDVDTKKDLYLGDDTQFKIILILFFIFLIVVGFLKNGKSFKGYGSLLKESGRLAADFVSQFNDGLVFINMGLCGFICLIYVFVSDGVINGPVIGGIFTVLAFSAFGKHPRNIIPTLTGIFIANHFSIHELNSTSAIVSGLFGTCIAPLAGYYGWPFGIAAGFIHTAMVNNIGFLHGGLNLYNNGFSGGFVAAILVPVFDLIVKPRQERTL